ncbi:MAG: chemotaxis protein CheA [Candidatus Hodarchaeales archaeon]
MSEFDSEEFKEVMLLELSERIEDLNRGLISLEKDPTEKAIYEDLMRTLHNLKGLFGLSGYQKLSTLSHSMENLIENTDSTEVTRAIKILFEFSDELKRFLKILKSGKSPDLLRFDHLTQQLASFDEIIVKLGNNLRIRVTFDPDCKVVSSRSLVLIKKLKEKATINRIIPPLEDIEEGYSFRELILEITTQEEEEEIVSICEESQDVASVKISHILDSISAAAKVTTEDELQELLTVRVNINDLDQIIRLLGDIVIYGQFLRESIIQENLTRSYGENLSNFERTISNIQDLVIKMRLVPLETIFNRFPRMVRDIASKEGKKIDFIITGKHIGVDRSIIEKLVDPLTHLLRNAISHGIETPDERMANGKDSVGVINLSVTHERSDIVIEIKDDGRGLDYDKIRRKLLDLGVISEDEDISNEQLHSLLLTTDLSTSEETTEVSGRGVGLTVVKKAMEQLGGSIEIKSEPRKFASFRLIIPLSIAIMKVLLLNVKDRQFAFPMSNIEQILLVPSDKFVYNESKNQKSIVVNNEPISIVDLRQRLKFRSSENKTVDIEYEKSKNIVVLWRKGSRSLGFIVDELHGERDVVVKPMDNFLEKIGAFSGATILEGGEVVFIIDPMNFIEVDLIA